MNSSYLAFLHGGIQESSDSAINDGRHLASQCLNQLAELDDPDQFPPSLLILLVSPAYLDQQIAGSLLNTIHQTFADAGHKDIPLVGCSTAAVFFDQKVYERGALLICLASRLFRAKVAVGEEAIEKPKSAIKELVDELDLQPKAKAAVTHENRTLLTFFPGFDGNLYPAPDLHKHLRSQIPFHTNIFGGVASASDESRLRPGILFAHKKVYRDAIVAARIKTSVSTAACFSQRLHDTNQILRVNELSEDRCSILSFHEASVADVVAKQTQKSPIILLSKICSFSQSGIDLPHISEDRQSLIMTRQIEEDCCFKILHPKPDGAVEETISNIKTAIQKTQLEKLLGCLMFKCAGLFRHRREIGLGFEVELAEIETSISEGNTSSIKCIGAFVDGEAGIDKYGKSFFRNWGTTTWVFSDNMSLHLPDPRSFAKFANLAKTHLATPQKTIETLLQLIYDLGFRGAMISFLLPDQQGDAIIARGAIGSRYARITDRTRRLLSDNDVLAQVANGKYSVFIPDSRLDYRCDDKAVELSGIVSQYIIPLISIEGDVNAILQFDLGNISHRTELTPQEIEMLEAIGEIVSATLTRTFSSVENEIKRELEKAFRISQEQETVNKGLEKYLELALQAFGLKEGYVRLASEENESLELTVGFGKLYRQVLKETLNKIDVGGYSPLAESFRNETLSIVNDTIKNRGHQWLCARYQGSNPETSKMLQNVVSYATVPFKTINEQQGIACLVAENQWFFFPYHKNAINAVGYHIGLLLENLHRKAEGKFLAGITPRLPQSYASRELNNSLPNAIQQFTRSANAEFASLFLWDDDQKAYILRAQYGWKDSKWVNAARYEKEDIWLGSIVLTSRPRYIANLHQYYKRECLHRDHQYSKEIFGEELSDHFTVEAIGIPLRLANEQIGVIALYRKTASEQLSGFTTTAPKLLLAAAASLTGHIKLLLTTNAEQLEKVELERNQEVYAACASLKEDESFEEIVCRKVISNYNASEVAFYSFDAHFNHVTSYHKAQNGIEIHTSIESPTKYEIESLRNKSNNALLQRQGLAKDQRKNRQIASIAGFLKRACIPLTASNKLIGLLIVKWDISNLDKDYSYHHCCNVHLEQLGEKVGSAYLQHKLAKQNKENEEAKIETERAQHKAEKEQRELERKSESAVKAVGAYMFQGAHRLRNFTQSIYNYLQFAKDAGLEEERISALQKLENTVTETNNFLHSTIDKGERFSKLALIECSLKSLIEEAIKDASIEILNEVIINWASIENLRVKADYELTKEALINLINNSIAATRSKIPRKLTISASIPDVNTAQVTVTDTGVGMTEEQITAAMNGFVNDGERKGVGVLISQVLLSAQGGSLKFRSTVDVGTDTIITLQLANSIENNKEERHGI